MRIQMRCFTRLTNAFSKKFENHMHMVALYTLWFNYVKQHKSLKGLSPAMAAGLSDTLWSVTDMAEMIDASLSKPGPRGPYQEGRVNRVDYLKTAKPDLTVDLKLYATEAGRKRLPIVLVYACPCTIQSEQGTGWIGYDGWPLLIDALSSEFYLWEARITGEAKVVNAENSN